MDSNLVKSAQVGRRIDEAAQNHQGEASQDEDSPSRLRENHIATAELRGPARLRQEENAPAG
jgi:hypothetical protein